MTPTWIGALLLAICGVLRSTDLFFRVPILDTLPVAVIIMWEHLIGSAAVLPAAWRYRKSLRRVRPVDILLFALIGIGASAMGIYCFTEAFRYMNPALVILLQKLQPIMTIALSMAFLGDRLSRRFFLLAPVAIIASYFVSFSTTNPFSGEWKQLAIGTGYTLLAALFWGSGTVWGKLLLNRFPSNFVLAGRFLVGAAFTVCLAVLTAGSDAFRTVIGHLPLLGSLAYMALIPGLAATGFFYWGLNRVAASLASMLELIFPVASVAIMWIFFHRPLDLIQITAGIILVISILLITREQTRSQPACNHGPGNGGNDFP